MANLFNNMIKAAALAAVMALGGTFASQAAIVSLSGTCDFGCGDVGIADGTAYSGEIELVDSVVVPNGSFDSSDVLGFSFELGTMLINDASAVAYNMSGTFDATVSTLVEFYIVATEAIADDTGEIMVLISNESFYSAGIDGYCSDETCTTGDGGEIVLSAPEIAVEASEPAILGLLGLGLAGFGIARRRRS
ncbi:PEP-CTERM sorting domain-containing protein [Emcibacter sp.]|uniref:PEP-CTERM sorting domain-containing protein n=1 Tax=Emcibacter sp. TaxID=1979954 RepID=UPI002AA69868|nr:PEP-CTERM sorting domain-containing protein [Emcibacter sp.]